MAAGEPPPCYHFRFPARFCQKSANAYGAYNAVRQVVSAIPLRRRIGLFRLLFLSGHLSRELRRNPRRSIEGCTPRPYARTGGRNHRGQGAGDERWALRFPRRFGCCKPVWPERAYGWSNTSCGRSSGQSRATIYLTRPLVFCIFHSWNANLRASKKRLCTSRIQITALTTLLFGAGRMVWSVPVAERRRSASTQIGALGSVAAITPSASFLLTSERFMRIRPFLWTSGLLQRGSSRLARTLSLAGS